MSDIDKKLRKEAKKMFIKMKEISAFPYINDLVEKRMPNTEDEITVMCKRGFKSLKKDTNLKTLRM